MMGDDQDYEEAKREGGAADCVMRLYHCRQATQVNQLRHVNHIEQLEVIFAFQLLLSQDVEHAYID